MIHSIKALSSTGKKPFLVTYQSPIILILKYFFTEALPDALEAFKNFRTTIPSIKKLNFSSISIYSDSSKSETVVGQILQYSYTCSIMHWALFCWMTLKFVPLSFPTKICCSLEPSSLSISTVDFRPHIYAQQYLDIVPQLLACVKRRYLSTKPNTTWRFPVVYITW